MKTNLVEPGIDIPNNIYVVIEIPKNNYVKYEICKNTGILYIDRFIKNKYPYPFNYGYINKTLSLDKDCLDAIVITNNILYPKSVILCKPIGILNMIDESGEDNKIISVPDNSISDEFENIFNIEDLPSNYIDKILFFFENYKNMEKNKWSKIIGYKNNNFAKDEILLCINRFKKNTND